MPSRTATCTCCWRRTTPTPTWATSSRPAGCGSRSIPIPSRPGKPFRQTLDLATGSIRIEADGVTLRIWADANRPVYHVEIDSPREIAVTARPEFWKRFDGCRFNVSEAADSGLPGAEPPQDVRLERDGKILWYFPVGDRSVYPDDLKFYEVEHMAAKFPDPYRFNTFGNLLESPSLTLKDGALRGTGKTFDIRIHALTMQTPKAETWIEAIERQAAQPGGRGAGLGAAPRVVGGLLGPELDRRLGPHAAAGGAREVQRRAFARRRPRGGGRRGAGRAELQRLPLPDGLPEPRAGPDQVQRRSVHPAVAREADPQAATARRRRAAGRHVAHARGRPALGPPLHLPEPAAALLAAAGQRRLRPDEAVLRLLLEPAADAPGDHARPGSATTAPTTARTSSRPAPSATAARTAARPRPSRARSTRAGITTTTSPAAWKRRR